MSNKTYVAGVNMTKFVKPGSGDNYAVMGAEAVNGALKDAGLDYCEVQQAYASFVYGDSTSGQHVLYKVGMTGIPVFNVNNNCASGSTALFMARQAVQSGVVECALAVGFEQMQPGVLASLWQDRPNPMIDFFQSLRKMGYSLDGAGGAPIMFGAGGMEYMKTYDAEPTIFAKVAAKTRGHAINNPYSIFNKPLTVEEVMAGPILYQPYLTRFMACPPTCGAAAAIVCSESFSRKHSLSNLVEIAGQGMTTDKPESMDCAMNIVGREMSRAAGKIAYEQAHIGPKDVDVVELHDCFTPNEVITYEALELCGEGGATQFIEDGDNTYGGRVVVNPSGGLMSKGHPLGATGLAQCTELCWHLRGVAGKRQVDGAKIALQHNLGLGGATVVTVYKKVA